MAGQVGQTLRQAVRLGGRKHRRNVQLLSSAAATSQKAEIHQHARALDGRDQARTLVVRIFPNAAACISQLPQRFFFLFAQRFHVEVLHGLNPVLMGFDGQRSHQPQASVTVSTGLTRAKRSQAALALAPLPASKVQSVPHQFAEFDKHNSTTHSVPRI